MLISIIIPILNEAPQISDTLLSLQSLRRAGHEVIVVDGGSTDDSAALSAPLADLFVTGPRGRSRQMNEGARHAKGEILLFLHADTFLPDQADQIILREMRRKKQAWGHFDVRLSGEQPLFRVIEFLMNLRSRLSSIATGDQGIFVRRDLFEQVNGFPDVDLMEDIAISKILKRISRPVCLRQRVITSSRRWEQKGILRTVLLMWLLRFGYFLKLDDRQLAKFYSEEG